MTLGSSGVLVVVVGLTGALAACGERPGDGRRDDSLRVDSARADRTAGRLRRLSSEIAADGTPLPFTANSTT